MLVVFLGNPGNEHKKTRHNAGFMLADAMESISGLNWSEKFNGLWTKADINGELHYFLKPGTFMNLSGKSVTAAKAFFKLNNDSILVVHDDIESDFGTISLKNGGGLAGHNGLRSISNATGSNDFPRLKIGIGRPSRGDVSSFVLGKFTEDEQIVLPIILEKAAKMLTTFLSEEPKRFVKEKVGI